MVTTRDLFAKGFAGSGEPLIASHTERGKYYLDAARNQFKDLSASLVGFTNQQASNLREQGRENIANTTRAAGMPDLEKFDAGDPLATIETGEKFQYSGSDQVEPFAVAVEPQSSSQESWAPQASYGDQAMLTAESDPALARLQKVIQGGATLM